MTRSEYAPSQPLSSDGGVIAAVAAGSPAERAGLRAGERVASADGVTMRDILDWQWHSDGDEVQLGVLQPDGSVRTVRLGRDAGEPWGLEFAAVLFDGVRTCRNSCSFCFMTQLPKGLRPALYVRDDDYRLSLLHGNFITLTNLGEDDVERICEQRLSPLYVSLHAVDPVVRQELVGARNDRALERLDELLGCGIDVHVQIVLVPGVNDGDQLEHTLTWLAEREGVESVGVVPLGFTAHQKRFERSYGDPIAAATVIQQVQRWQFAMKERDAISWVHLADEFYLNARAPIPTADWYDGFPQYENGIGIVRSFVDEATELREAITDAVAALPADQDMVTIVTGMMSATTLAGALNACEAAGRVRLLVVPNRFFGGNVSVTGLLAGQDLVKAMASDGARGIYLVPDIMFNSDGVTVDDMTLQEIAEQSGATVRLVSSDAAGLLAGLESAAADLEQTD